MNVAPKNRKRGADFEEIFKRIAGFQHVLVLHNWLTARYTFYKGSTHLQVVKGELDFRMIKRNGDVAYIDCKCYQDVKFNYSMLDEHQINRAVLYNEWNVPSGFVVMFVPVNRLVFFTGQMIAKKGPGNSFGYQEGILLGTMTKCDMELIFKSRGSRP